MATDGKEITFYSDDRGVQVTNTRIMVANTTYAMANVSAVARNEIRPSYNGAILVVVLGLVFAVAGFVTGAIPLGVLGLLILGAGIWWGISLKPTYDLEIFSASAKSSALRDRDKAYVEKLVGAIHEAIIHRG